MRKINYGDGRFNCPWGLRNKDKTMIIIGSNSCMSCNHCGSFYDKTIECKYDETIKK